MSLIIMLAEKLLRKSGLELMKIALVNHDVNKTCQGIEWTVFEASCRKVYLPLLMSLGHRSGGRLLLDEGLGHAQH